MMGRRKSFEGRHLRLDRAHHTSEWITRANQKRQGCRVLVEYWRNMGNGKAGHGMDSPAIISQRCGSAEPHPLRAKTKAAKLRIARSRPEHRSRRVVHTKSASAARISSSCQVGSPKMRRPAHALRTKGVPQGGARSEQATRKWKQRDQTF